MLKTKGKGLTISHLREYVACTLILYEHFFKIFYVGCMGMYREEVIDLFEKSIDVGSADD